MSKSSKGSSYEREICKRLSEWWSGGTRDDIFWRSAGSGGRATMRSKRGASTFGQYGDIQAVDPIGAPLIKAVTIELKRGYSKTSFADAIDRTDRVAAQTWELFVEQASTSAEAAGSFSWILIQRRDKREALVFFPRALYLALRRLTVFEPARPFPFLAMQLEVKTSKKKWQRHSLVTMTLNDFLEHCPPAALVQISKQT